MSAKQRRQGTRLCVKRELDKILPILNKTEPLNLDQLELSVSKLDKYMGDLKDADSSVLGEITDDSVIDAEILETAQYNDTVLECVSRAKVMIKKAGNVAPQTSNGAAYQTPLRLPKLEIAPFSGNALEFQGFWDSFDSSVHSNNKLSDIEKFNYLKTLLTGDALKAVEGYRLSAANYGAVLECLTERFGNKQMAIFGHFEAMLALPQANHDVNQLQSVSDSCERHIRSLVALGLDESTFGQVFTPIMLSKLPKYVKIEMHRKNGSQTWSLSHLREWLKDEIRARELGQRNFGEGHQSEKEETVTERADPKPKPHRFAPKKFPTTTSALVSSASNDTSPKCVFCDGKHYSDRCETHADVDSRREKAAKRCFSCLGSGHQAGACRRKVPCVYCKKLGHHRSLCYSKFRVGNKVPPSKSETGLTVNTSEVKSVSGAGSGNMKRTILQTALATVQDPNGSCVGEARLLFDTAGSRSFITEQKRSELQLPYVGEELISIAGFQSSKRKTSKYKLVDFEVKCSDGSLQRVTASVVPTITCPVQKIPIDPVAHPVIKGLQLSEPVIKQPEFVGIDVLIGLDHYYDFVLAERIQCLDGPLFLASRLGFIATGRVSTQSTGPETIAVMLLNSKTSDSIPRNACLDIERYWDLEDIGIKEVSRELSGDDEALAFHSATLQRGDDGRYHSKWPWKQQTADLPDNFDVAHGRLKSLVKRISQNQDVLKAYSKSLSEQHEKGIIEVAPPLPPGRTSYYMPHHCVLTPSKATTKLRVVYDASCRSRKDVPSLNDCLHRGPVMLEDLCGLLLRFRFEKVALVSDVEKAFLQIGLQEEDRDVTRFLWVNDVTKPPIGDNLAVFRFTRVPFGVISSPFVLENTVCRHLENTGGSVATKIWKNHYVDNVITGEATDDAAISHYKEAKTIFQSACMNLREWYSNSTVVRSAFAAADRGSESEPKILGVRWNPESDRLRCVSPSADKSMVLTKRSILSSVSEVFDPLGWFAPVTVAGKILIQDLWKAGNGWDEQLSADVRVRWMKLLQNLEQISVSEIPRFIGATAGSKMELHVFCDASAKVAAAAAYIRKTDSGGVSCDLIMSKTRLAPTKQEQTIPRLELIAVVIGVRLLGLLKEQLRIPIDAAFIWTDSQCTLHWIKRERVATRFVENRVREIRKITGVQFHYVPTKENPADLPSRGCDTSVLMSTKLWWHGPPWLLSDSAAWPVFESPATSSVSDDVCVNNVTATPAVSLIDATRFSSFQKLLRVAAYVLRFVKNCRLRPEMRISGPLTAAELVVSRTMWHIWVQAGGFPEISAFKGPIWPKGLARQLNLFRDTDGVLRCKGRVQTSELPYDAKYPVLIPKNCHFTSLVIQDCHQKVMHSGVAQTLAEIRQQYWVPHGRSTVKGILRSCRRCLRVEGGPYKVPPVPILPKSRVEATPAFTCIGLDYLGPLCVRVPEGGRKKVWVCLFTCMVVRAVHLEVVEELSTDQFLLCLRRFMSIYGVPARILSDNASQFHASAKVLHKLWDDVVTDNSVQDFAANRGIHWEFIVEFAPWMGGFYERLVGVVKRALKKSLRDILATLPELQTLVYEIGSVVNSRPLVYVEDDVGSRPLTPNDFLLKGYKGSIVTFSDTDEYGIGGGTQASLMQKWKRLQNISLKFWNIWLRQYLTSLREREVQHRQRNTRGIPPKVGTVVQISDNMPRGQWKLGRVCQLHHGRDDCIRSVSVQLGNGKIVRRPVKLLYPLELEDDHEKPVNSVSETDKSVSDAPRKTLKRLAAVKATTEWRDQLDGDSESDAASEEL